MVRRMVDFFYTGDYKDEDGGHGEPECSGDGGLSPLRIHARMFALADMYQVDDLMTLAVGKYVKALKQGAGPTELLEPIPDVYRSTPSSVRALRDKAVAAIRGELERPGAKDALLAAYDDIADAAPAFIKDLLTS